jgi:hypothetical protein
MYSGQNVWTSPLSQFLSLYILKRCTNIIYISIATSIYCLEGIVIISALV